MGQPGSRGQRGLAVTVRGRLAVAGVGYLLGLSSSGSGEPEPEPTDEEVRSGRPA